MNNFWQRTITGSIFVLTIIALTLYNGFSYMMLLYVINFLCLLEFYELMLPDKRPLEKYLGLIAGSIIMAMFILIITDYLSFGWAFHLIPVFMLIVIIKLLENTGREFEVLAYQFAGIIYITLPLSMLADLCFLAFS